MENLAIVWQKPWRAIQTADSTRAIQRRLEHEITHAHPLTGKGATAIGQRIDNDDVLARLSDGTYVNIHLVWGSGPERFPDKYPDWFVYGTADAFIKAMHEDAEEYGSVA